MNIKTYILVFDEELETWYYFLNDFDSKLFKNGYVEYYVEVDNEKDIIVSDTWNYNNVGKIFSETYNFIDEILDGNVHLV